MTRTIIRTIRLALTSLALSAGLIAGPSLAQEADHKHVLNLAGKQRMLSQRMSKEILLIALAYNVRENLRNLKSNSDSFERVLNGLRYGNAELALHPIDDPRVLDQLSEVEDLWPQFAVSLREIANKGTVSPEALQIMSEISLPLLKAMNGTVQAYEDASNEGNLFSMLGRAVNLAGRQRMLTQKMSKEYLLVAYGQNVEANRRRLAETYEVFELTLEGLMNGDNALKLPPPPNQQIHAQLKKVKRLWLEFKPLMQKAARGEEIDSDGLADMASLNLTLLNEMNDAVNMYEAL